MACGGETDQLPDSLRALVAARLDELPPDQRAMLDNAAVLGSSGSYAGLVEFGQALGQNTSRSLLDALADAGLLEVEGGWWRFRSASVREVAYHTITKADRARRHIGVAKAMTADAHYASRPDVVAHHWATAAELAGELGGGRLPGIPRTWSSRPCGRSGLGHQRRRPPLPAPGHRSGGASAVDRRLRSRRIDPPGPGPDQSRRLGRATPVPRGRSGPPGGRVRGRGRR